LLDRLRGEKEMTTATADITALETQYNKDYKAAIKKLGSASRRASNRCSPSFWRL
jgi:hypothetical protein